MTSNLTLGQRSLGQVNLTPFVDIFDTHQMTQWMKKKSKLNQKNQADPNHSRVERINMGIS